MLPVETGFFLFFVITNRGLYSYRKKLIKGVALSYFAQAAVQHMFFVVGNKLFSFVCERANSPFN